MRVLGWVVLTMVACRPQPAERLANVERLVTPSEPAPRPHLAIALRPELDLTGVLPDPTEQARWPLSAAAHPALEPRFAIANALAEPGIEWTELCRMGAQHRHLSGDRDLGTYLAAWCRAASGDPAAAFAELALMSNPTVSGMAPAIRTDLADLLVQNGDADHAEHLLAAAKVEDIAIFDLLAASYFEVGKYADAAEINERAIDRQLRSTDAAKCHRFARRIILKSPTERPFYRKELDDLGAELVRWANKLSTDAECAALDDTIGCWVAPATECRHYLGTQHLDPLYEDLFSAYFTWPDGPASFRVWLDNARTAQAALPLPGADQLATAALGAAFRTVSCENVPGLQAVHDVAVAVRNQPQTNPAFHRQLDDIATSTAEMARSIKRCHASGL